VECCYLCGSTGALEGDAVIIRDNAVLHISGYRHGPTLPGEPRIAYP